MATIFSFLFHLFFFLSLARMIDIDSESECEITMLKMEIRGGEDGKCNNRRRRPVDFIVWKSC